MDIQETTVLLENARLYGELERAAQVRASHGRCWLVLEGDYGGQIYLTVPWDLIGERPQILTLLREVDRAMWDCNEGSGARAWIHCPAYLYAILKQEDPEDDVTIDELYGVSGGMGGGTTADGLWLHNEFVRPEHCPERANRDWYAQATLLLNLASTT